MNCFGGFLDHYNNYSNPQINAMVRSTYGPGALYPGGSGSTPPPMRGSCWCSVLRQRKRGRAAPPGTAPGTA